MSDQPSTLQPYFLPKLGLIYALAGQQRQEYCKMLSTAARTPAAAARHWTDVVPSAAHRRQE